MQEWSCSGPINLHDELLSRRRRCGRSSSALSGVSLLAAVLQQLGKQLTVTAASSHEQLGI
jgi:hypothetical protein